MTDLHSAPTTQEAPLLTLVLGGARSGKSRTAEALVTNGRNTRHIYLATATAGDDEMRARIATHRRQRAAAGWETVEEPLALRAVLLSQAGPGRTVLVDCLTLWLSNLMLAGRDADAETQALASDLPRLGGPVVFVSTEVGWGIVPDNALARAFRDAQGRLNQLLAQQCHHVVLVAAGLPIVLKQGARP